MKKWIKEMKEAYLKQKSNLKTRRITWRQWSLQEEYCQGQGWVNPESLSYLSSSQSPRYHTAVEKYLSTKLLLSFLGSTLCPGPSRSAEQGEAKSRKLTRPVKSRRQWQVETLPQSLHILKGRQGSKGMACLTRCKRTSPH
jgi:hypothetical protein